MIYKDINIGGATMYAVLDFTGDVVIGQIKSDKGHKGLAFIQRKDSNVIGQTIAEIPPQVIMFFRDLVTIDNFIEHLKQLQESMKPKIITDENTNRTN